MHNDTIFNLLNNVNELNHIHNETIKLKKIQRHPTASPDNIASLKEIFGKTLSATLPTETDFGKASPNTRANENPMNMQEVQAFLRKQFQKISAETNSKKVENFSVSRPFSVSIPLNQTKSLNLKQVNTPENKKETTFHAETFSRIGKNTQQQPVDTAPDQSVMATQSAPHRSETLKDVFTTSFSPLPLKHLNSKGKANRGDSVQSHTQKRYGEIAAPNTDFTPDKTPFTASALPAQRSKAQKEHSAPMAPVLFPKPERDALLAILQAIHDKLPRKSAYQPAPVTMPKYVSRQNNGLMTALRQTIR